MTKQRRRARHLSSMTSATTSDLACPERSNAELATQLREHAGGQRDRRGGLLGRMFRRRQSPQPRPVAPRPVVDVPTPAVVEPGPVRHQPEPVTHGPAELPAWANDLSEDEALDLPTGRELIEGWEQTSKGNCVTVAAIKAAQKTFGPQLVNLKDPELGVFNSAQPLDDGGMKIVMRDGFALEVSAKELEEAAKSSRFKTDVGRDDLLDNANHLYAVAAKRAQIEGNDGYGPNKMSYTRALQSLEDGEHTSRVMEQVGRLGLKDYAHKAPRSELKNYDSTLSSGAGHAYFVSNGDRDYYGKVGPLGGKAYTTRARGRRGRIVRHPAHSSEGTVLHRKKLEK